MDEQTINPASRHKLNAGGKFRRQLRDGVKTGRAEVELGSKLICYLTIQHPHASNGSVAFQDPQVNRCI